MIVVAQHEKVVTVTAVPGRYGLWVAVGGWISVGISGPRSARVGVGVYVPLEPPLLGALATSLAQDAGEKMGSAEGLSPFAGSLRVTLRYKISSLSYLKGRQGAD